MVKQTCLAWGEDEDRSGAATGLDAITDDLFEDSGDTLKLSSEYPYIGMIYINTEFSTYQLVYAKLTAASITQRPLLLSRNYAAGVGTKIHSLYDWRSHPYGGIKVGDPITASSYEEDEAGVAHKNSLVAIVCDGVIPTIDPSQYRVGNPILHRCTPGAAIATAFTWQTITLTEESSLEPGKYRMWGADVVSASAIAARFIFKNSQVGRPAVIPRRREDNGLHPFSEMWGSPVEFTYPGGLPSLELLAETTDTADHITLLLEQLS